MNFQKNLPYNRKRIAEIFRDCENLAKIGYHLHTISHNIKIQYPSWNAWTIIVELKKKKNFDGEEVLKAIGEYLK